MPEDKPKRFTRQMNWQEYEAAYRKERPNALSTPVPSKYGYGIAYSLTGAMPMITVNEPEKELRLTKIGKGIAKA